MLQQADTDKIELFAGKKRTRHRLIEQASKIVGGLTTNHNDSLLEPPLILRAYQIW